MGGKRVTTESFISRALETHGDTYDYDKSVYISSKIQITIKCKIHGYFKQLPYNHLKGKGCSKCALDAASKRYIYTLDQVLSKFREIHGDRYDYSLVEYTGIKNKINIICKDHGAFYQDAGAHIVSKGCDKCARQILNYRKSDYLKMCKDKHNGLSNFYILKMKEDNGVIFYKIGITVQKLKWRYRKGEMPYDYDVLVFKSASAESVFDLELKIKKLMINDTYSPIRKFAGSRYECFINIPDEVIKMVDSLI